MLYQGLLLGLFVNGTARWGFASIIETKGILLGDAVYGSGRIPILLPPSGGNITWEYNLQGGWMGNWDEQKVLSDQSAKNVWWQNVTIRWHWPTSDENRLYDRETGLPIEGTKEWGGVSLIINDVERYEAPIPEAVAGEIQVRGGGSYSENKTVGSFTWSRMSLPKRFWNGETIAWEKLYIRLAYTTSKNTRGVGDYTKPGIVGWGWPKKGDGEEGGWIPPPPGRT